MALALLSLLLTLHGYREYCARRALPQIHHADFEGEVMKVDSTYIARRYSRNGSGQTIVCFPGFLEDMRYFQDLYHDSDAELILIDNANYHFPFIAPGKAISSVHLDWPQNLFSMGSIGHDAFYLGLVLEKVATGEEVLLHGHSRGGAVILDTGRQYPSLVKGTERRIRAILEAPVLPQARSAGTAAKPFQHWLLCYLVPIFFNRWRHVSTDRLLKLPMMQPTTAVKTELCQSLFSVPKNYRTCVENIRSIRSWQRDTPFDIYRNLQDLVIVLGEKDSILDLTSMRTSAVEGKKLNHRTVILETTGTNHFISLEQPETMRNIWQKIEK